MNNSSLQQFHDLLSDYPVAVLVTRTQGSNTPFHARPMAIARIDENCDLWFITSDESAKVYEIEANPGVLIICQDGRSGCVTVAGKATLVQDRTQIHALWKPAFKAWFPDGEDDPSIVLIHVRGEHGEFWDNHGLNGIRYAFQALKAVVTGTNPAVTEGEQHGQIDLKPIR